MQLLREYVMGIGAAALICGIVLSFGSKGTMKPLLKLTCGLVLTFSILSPILKITGGNLEDLGIEYKVEAEKAAEEGKQQAIRSVRQIIKEETQAYIMDKARDLSLELAVEVNLSEEALPKPVAVTIRGLVPPYEKSVIRRMLTEELGIAKENQKWISQG